MKYDLKEKTIILIGANSGIGKAAAIQLAKCDATLVIDHRSKRRGLQVMEDVRWREHDLG